MTEAYLHFEIRSFFQTGTGHGVGLLANTLTLKDADGFPFLGGKTVKGLCRDAVARAEHWGHLPVGHTDRWFGSRAPAGGGLTRYETQPGRLAFDNAVLSSETRRRLLQEDADHPLRDGLFRYIHATAIDAGSGSAKDQSLRTMEVAVPLTLVAPVRLIDADDLPDADWQKTLRLCLPLIRGLGQSRSRGLGRVRVLLKEENL